MIHFSLLAFGPWPTISLENILIHFVQFSQPTKVWTFITLLFSLMHKTLCAFHFIKIHFGLNSFKLYLWAHRFLGIVLWNLRITKWTHHLPLATMSTNRITLALLSSIWVRHFIISICIKLIVVSCIPWFVLYSFVLFFVIISWQ